MAKVSLFLFAVLAVLAVLPSIHGQSTPRKPQGCGTNTNGVKCPEGQTCVPNNIFTSDGECSSGEEGEKCNRDVSCKTGRCQWNGRCSAPLTTRATTTTTSPSTTAGSSTNIKGCGTNTNGIKCPEGQTCVRNNIFTSDGECSSGEEGERCDGKVKCKSGNNNCSSGRCRAPPTTRSTTTTESTSTTASNEKACSIYTNDERPCDEGQKCVRTGFSREGVCSSGEEGERCNGEVQCKNGSCRFGRCPTTTTSSTSSTTEASSSTDDSVSTDSTASSSEEASSSTEAA